MRSIRRIISAQNAATPCFHSHNHHVVKQRNAQNRVGSRIENAAFNVQNCNFAGNRCYSSLSSSSKTESNEPSGSELQLSHAIYERGKDASKKSPILIHHNLCGRKENLTKLGKQLFHLTKRNIILPDARNHGNSPESPAMSHKLMSGDIVRLLTSLSLKEASILGLGIGGRIGMYTALVRPDLVDRLVVVSSSPVNTEKRLHQWDNLIQSFYVIKTLAAGHSESETKILLKSQDFRMVANEALKSLLPSASDRALFVSNLGQFNMSALHSNPGLWKFPDLENCQFKKPVLFLSGSEENTWSFSDNDIRRTRGLFPDSHFVKVKNSSLYPHLESQDEFLEAVTSFLEADLESLHGYPDSELD